MKPSKRTVRDAIRILGYAVQHDIGCMDAAAALGLPDGSGEIAVEVDLALDAAIHEDATGGLPCGLGGRVIDRARRAAAENLLREGWLP